MCPFFAEERILSTAESVKLKVDLICTIRISELAFREVKKSVLRKLRLD